MTAFDILIIDDDVAWHKFFGRLFRTGAYEVHAASSCEEGVRLAEYHKPDCILLDFHLNDGNAVDVCSALRKGGERPKFPVIVVSSDPEAEIKAYAECRADCFVLKGSQNMMELPKIVGEVLKNRALGISREAGD